MLKKMFKFTIIAMCVTSALTAWALCTATHDDEEDRYL